MSAKQDTLNTAWVVCDHDARNVRDSGGNVIAECTEKAVAEFIVLACNAYGKPQARRLLKGRGKR